MIHTRAHTHTQFLWKEWIKVSYHSLSHHCPGPILVVHKRIWALSSFTFIIWPTLYYWTFPANPLVAPLLFSCSVVFNSFGTSWTVTGQGPLSMGFSRQEYQSGLPSPPPGDLPDLGIQPALPTLQVHSLPLRHQEIHIALATPNF